MRKIIYSMAGICIFLFACNGVVPLNPTSMPMPTLAPTLTLTSTPLASLEPATLPPTFADPATFTASPVPTAVWIHQGPYEVVLPIFMYHRIDVSPSNSRYYVSPDKFEAEIKLLHDWGYATITLDMLAQAINEGADLPPRPMLITFDDGHLNNYTTAFPIMQKYGFTGNLYIVGSYMGADQYMNADQIKEMAGAGWEVGSHSMRHLDLTTLDLAEQKYEIFQSRKFLQEKLGLPIRSFGYPFGNSNTAIVDLVRLAGYTTGMSLGYTDDQGTGNILTLQRRDVKGTYDIKQFALFLPWQGDPIFLPTDTPTPTLTPSRTPNPTETPRPSRTPKPTATLSP
jgi:peptidoglycan/xylan/chitin deacetylase (PgdA/CDA1 family)